MGILAEVYPLNFRLEDKCLVRNVELHALQAKHLLDRGHPVVIYFHGLWGNRFLLSLRRSWHGILGGFALDSGKRFHLSVEIVSPWNNKLP